MKNRPGALLSSTLSNAQTKRVWRNERQTTNARLINRFLGRIVLISLIHGGIRMCGMKESRPRKSDKYKASKQPSVTSPQLLGGCPAIPCSASGFLEHITQAESALCQKQSHATPSPSNRLVCRPRKRHE